MSKILILTTKTPFVFGGAEFHTAQLRGALVEAGHQVDVIEYPFNYTSSGDIVRSMYFCESENIKHLDMGNADQVICLKFPAYYASHSNKVVWLIHQHRPVYDEWQDDANHSPYLLWMKEKIFEYDEKYLRPLSPSRLFTISPNVSERLMRYQTITSKHLYHPPPILNVLRHADAERFIFCPTRLEALKRASLLISAMSLVKSPIRAVIAGVGGQHEQLVRQIEKAGLRDRVQLLSPITREELIDLYARCMGVFYGPRDEDLGYVTLEAMIAKKPVITCTDSGGTLAFIESGRNGFVTEPTPENVALAIEQIGTDKARAYRMGQEGFRKYIELDITWHNVVEKLVSAGLDRGS
jgi:glycosyltransferase involved in cell wall biosynthesis